MNNENPDKHEGTPAQGQPDGEPHTGGRDSVRNRASQPAPFGGGERQSGTAPHDVRRLAEWEEWTDAELDALKAGLKAAGRPEVSVYLLTHPNEPRAKCPPCDLWFAITELERANGCPECGQANEFEIPDECAAAVAEAERAAATEPSAQGRSPAENDPSSATREETL